MQKYLIGFLLLISVSSANCQDAVIPPMKILKGHLHKINHIEYNKSGTLMASCSWDNTVRIWDMNSFTEKKVLYGHDDKVSSVKFSPDEKYLISGSLDASMIIWDTKTGELLKRIKISPKEVTLKGAIPEWDTKYPNSLSGGVFNLKGDLLITGSADGLILIFDMNKFEFMDTLYGHKGPATNFAISDNGKLLASGSWQNEIIIWDVESYEILHHIKTKNNSAYSLRFINDNKSLFSAGHCSINIWDIESETIIRTFEGQCGLQQCKFSPDGKYLASSAEDSTVWLRNFKTGKLIWKYKGPQMEISTLDFSPNGEYIAIGTPESDILIWKMEDIIKD